MKNVVVTGGSRGIGYGLAKHLLLAGCNVTICGRNEDRLKKAVTQLKEETKNESIYAVVCDVSDHDSLENLWHKATDYLGSIDIWINNAGMDQTRKHSYDMTREETDRIIDVNIKGVIFGTSIALSEMIKLGGGFIYNMEGFGSDGMMRPELTLYGTTKRALRYFTQSTAKEAKGTGVKVCRLSPGMVLTDFLYNGLPEDKEVARKTERIFAILADDAEDVTKYLVKKVLHNTKNDVLISWLTKAKVMRRFINSKKRIRSYEKRTGRAVSKL
ncbi:MAG: SDR family NAD(P)-dependent oxidoreductase [Vallitaleaceae bacterium]|nr:SDR family NAD(P)-dependent oxidoreductase [Vallitaleaceae bacterium]